MHFCDPNTVHSLPVMTHPQDFALPGNTALAELESAGPCCYPTRAEPCGFSGWMLGNPLGSPTLGPSVSDTASRLTVSKLRKTLAIFVEYAKRRRTVSNCSDGASINSYRSAFIVSPKRRRYRDSNPFSFNPCNFNCQHYGFPVIPPAPRAIPCICRPFHGATIGCF